MDVMKTGWHSKNRLIDTRLEHLIGSKLLFSAFDWLIDPIWLFRVPITWLAIWDLYDLWLAKHQFSQIWLDPELGFAQLSCNCPATAWQRDKTRLTTAHSFLVIVDWLSNRNYEHWLDIQITDPEAKPVIGWWVCGGERLVRSLSHPQGVCTLHQWKSFIWETAKYKPMKSF